MTTTTKTDDYIGRDLTTPDTDARDYLGRGIMAGDRDYMGRLLTGGGGGDVSALLDEAAVRFDFSEYDDLLEFYDVNGDWGPAKLLIAFDTVGFVAEGLQLTSTVEGPNWPLKVGLTAATNGPLIFGPAGLTLVNVVHLVDDLDETVALSIRTDLLQGNSIGLGTGYPQGQSTWAVTSDAAATFYDMEPSEDTIADLYEDFSPFEALDAGIYVAVTILDVDSQEVRLRLVGPSTDQAFVSAFVKVPDYASDPVVIDDLVSLAQLTFTEDLGVASVIQVEYDGWNRVLTPAEVDALVAHFTA